MIPVLVRRTGCTRRRSYEIASGTLILVCKFDIRSSHGSSLYLSFYYTFIRFSYIAGRRAAACRAPAAACYAVLVLLSSALQ